MGFQVRALALLFCGLSFGLLADDRIPFVQPNTPFIGQSTTPFVGSRGPASSHESKPSTSDTASDHAVLGNIPAFNDEDVRREIAKGVDGNKLAARLDALVKGVEERYNRFEKVDKYTLAVPKGEEAVRSLMEEDDKDMKDRIDYVKIRLGQWKSKQALTSDDKQEMANYLVDLTLIDQMVRYSTQLSLQSKALAKQKIQMALDAGFFKPLQAKYSNAKIMEVSLDAFQKDPDFRNRFLNSMSENEKKMAMAYAAKNLDGNDEFKKIAKDWGPNKDGEPVAIGNSILYPDPKSKEEVSILQISAVTDPDTHKTTQLGITRREAAQKVFKEKPGSNERTVAFTKYMLETAEFLKGRLGIN